MTSWKYTPGRFILSAFLVLVIFRAIKLLLDVHVEAKVTDSSAANSVSSRRETAKIICDYGEDGLASFVWSHRAHYSDLEVDGSPEAVEQLLKFGIRNFDVDVSCNILPGSDACEFVIAHPSVFADKEKMEHRKHIKSVTAFLNQIHTYVQANTREKSANTVNVLMPVITLEMKFTKASHQIEFAKLVQTSPLAAYVAIIGSDSTILQTILPYLSESGVAAAYRTKPFTSHDYTWPEPAYSEHHTLSSGGLFFGEQTEKQSFTSVPPPIVIASAPKPAKSKADRSNAITKAQSSAVVDPNSTSVSTAALSKEDVTLISNSQTLHIRSPQVTNRKYLQIYMPDVKLLKHPLQWQKEENLVKTTGQNSTVPSASAHDPQTLVVAWVVDTNAELFDAIAKGVDGVISNRPVALLAELRSLYAQYCRAGGGKIK